jgi:hypothetical protein
MIKVPLGVYCTLECASEHSLAKSKAKAKARIVSNAKAIRSKQAADKRKVRTREEWFNILGKLVNQYVNHVRDAGKPCCTCGKTSDVKYDAGHYRSRGACKELRFELTNIHRQCSVNCNQHGSGMRHEYREFIINKYGKDHLDWLDGPHPSLKEQFPHYTDIEAEAKRYRKLISDSGLKPVT